MITIKRSDIFIWSHSRPRAINNLNCTKCKAGGAAPSLRTQLSAEMSGFTARLHRPTFPFTPFYTVGSGYVSFGGRHLVDGARNGGARGARRSFTSPRELSRTPNAKSFPGGRYATGRVLRTGICRLEIRSSEQRPARDSSRVARTNLVSRRPERKFVIIQTYVKKFARLKSNPGPAPSTRAVRGGGRASRARRPARRKRNVVCTFAARGSGSGAAPSTPSAWHSWGRCPTGGSCRSWRRPGTRARRRREWPGAWARAAPAGSPAARHRRTIRSRCRRANTCRWSLQNRRLVNVHR